MTHTTYPPTGAHGTTTTVPTPTGDLAMTGVDTTTTIFVAVACAVAGGLAIAHRWARKDRP